MTNQVQTQIKSWEDYKKVYAYSLEHRDEFWAKVAQEYLTWRKPWKTTSNCDYHAGKIEWYAGGQLNVSENCLDRHLAQGKGEKTALIWVGNEPGEERTFTYRELHQEVCRVANSLEKLGVKKGDRVVLYLPSIPELAIACLASARIGATHSVIFGGFSAQSIQGRVSDCGAKVIITADGMFRGAKWVDLKANVDEALAMGCPSVEKVVVVERGKTARTPTGVTVGRWSRKALDLTWSEFLVDSADHVAPAHDSNDPLYILYTSGSTGKPKGVMHSMGGYLTYVTYTFELVFQPKENDVYWCTADLGWITGHSYLLYGPLAYGTTTLMYEGVPTYPDAGRFWDVIDRYGVNIFYTAPTAIRMLASAGDEWVKRSSRRSLRTLGSVGEPINPEAWRWYSEVVGEDRCPIVDTWWQTETGGVLISPLAGITPLKPGSATLPLPGVEPKILDEEGKTQTGAARGSLVLARSWPGQMLGVYGEPRRFYETYFTRYSGSYFTGDGVQRDEDGNYTILGRTDDVIKVSGHRLGTAEIESACITHDQVMESAAVGVPDAMTGEALHVFVVAKDPGAQAAGVAPWTDDLVKIVRKEVGPLATPKKIHWVPGLPKTRSGKIMRRILKKVAVADFENLGDISTLAEPAIVEKIIAAERAAHK